MAAPISTPRCKWRPLRPSTPLVRAGLTDKDKAFYIFDFRTTGLPKAANINTCVRFFAMYGFAGGLTATPQDRMHNLPLYHSSGGICAVGVAFTVCAAKGGVNSPHEFWDDCFRYKPTFFQYIGEMCRYLLTMPSGCMKRDHTIRAIGVRGCVPRSGRIFSNASRFPRSSSFMAPPKATFRC